MRKAIKFDAQSNLNKLGCKFYTEYFTGHIDMVVMHRTFCIYLTVDGGQQNQKMAQAIQNYFNQRLQKCFYNYKALKGFLGMILTTLYEYLSVDELIHFDSLQFHQGTIKTFYRQHTNQADLDRLMKNQKLNIEIVLDQFDFQEEGKYFSLKFIDPQTSLYKIIRFTRSQDNPDINPEGLMNPAYKE